MTEQRTNVTSGLKYMQGNEGRGNMWVSTAETNHKTKEVKLNKKLK